MTTGELLSYLRERGVLLHAEGETLRIKAPKGVMTPELQTQLSAHKEEILRTLRRHEHPGRSSIPRVRRDGPLPLSFSQERLWFLAQLDPGSPAYNIPLAVRLCGELSHQGIEQAIGEIVRRHEVLRTRFELLDGKPVQVIKPARPMPLPFVDLSTVGEAERTAEIERLALAETQRRFDLSQGSMVRVILLRLHATEHILLATMHHVVSDGWSMGLFMRELTLLYRTFLAGEAAGLRELPIQYADFAVWQRQWLQGEVLEEKLAYWRHQLRDLEPRLDLTTDRPRKAVVSDRGASQTLVLSQSLSRSLTGWSTGRGSTLFMTLLTAFLALLHRYTGQSDLSLGTPIAGRNRVETEDLIGFFINTVVLRVDASSNPHCGELLERVRKVALEAYANQELPFEKLVEALQPERSLSHTPLFDVMFSLQNTPTATLELSGLTLSPLDVKGTTAKFDLTLAAVEQGPQIAVALTYRTELFDGSTVRRLLGHFERLLSALIADPQQKISSLPLLTEAETNQLLQEWGGSWLGERADVCIHTLFERQVERRPQQLAVACGDERLTYRDLNTLSNRLAFHLRNLGVGPEVLVGVLLGRSVHLMTAILGILKAGGAYVPLDPEAPAQRLAFLLDDSQAPVVVTTERLAGRLSISRPRLVRLDADREELDRQSSGNPHCQTAGENLAYGIYTSGSTGTPKGTLIPHAAVVNLARALRESIYEDLERPLRIGLNAPVIFDGSVKQWVQITWGHTVHVLPQEVRLEGGALLDHVEDRQLDLLDCTPVQLRLMLDAGLDRDLRPFPRSLLVGGEALDQEVWERLGADPARRCFNVYGPTECTVDVTAARIEAGVASTIGRPLQNIRVYVLDRELQLVPLGQAGELCVEGACLARGYLGRPDLTAEKFVPNPWSPPSGERLYRTGDQVRWTSDGKLEFLGRFDRQVKIRGHRIELGEVEAILRSCPEVRDCVVLAREIAGERSLIAYVIPKSEAATVAGMRGGLRERLPEAMVPSSIVFLEVLPLTASGKLDRRALPDPEAFSSAGGDRFVAPRDELELLLTGIWGEVLGVQTVGVRDDFFDLGGHSLLAARLMARLREVLGVILPVNVLFQSSTVEQLAAALRTRTPARAPNLLVAMQPRGTRAPLFLVHPSGGGIFCYTSLVRRLGDERPVYGLQSQGLQDEEIGPATLETIAAAYVRLLSSVQPEGPCHLLGWSMGGVLAFEMARQLREEGREVPFLALIDAAVHPSGGAEEDEIELLGGFALSLGLALEDLRQQRGEVQSMPPQKRLAALLEQVHAMGLVPPDYDQQELERLYRVFRHNSRAHSLYQPQPYSGRVLLLRAAERIFEVDPGDDLGWGRVAAAVEVELVPGNHYTVIRDPNVTALAQVIAARLNAADGS